MAWTILLYIFSVLLGVIIIYCVFFTKKKTRKSSSPSSRYNTIRKILPVGTKTGWKLIGVEHGLRLWERNEFGHGTMFASATVVPVSIENVMKVLVDTSDMLEWDPRVKHISRISMSNENDSSSQLCGDVISITEVPHPSFNVFEAFDMLVSLFLGDSKLCSRTWHHEESIQFWLHSAIVEAQTTDPVYTMFLAFPLKDSTDKFCEVVVASEAMSKFKPYSLTAKLAGLTDYLVHNQSVALYPEIKIEANHTVADDEIKEFDEVPDEDSFLAAAEEHPGAFKEAFVDVTGVYLRNDVQRYKPAIESATKKLMEYYYAKHEENGWSFVGNIKKVEVLKKPASPGFSIWDCSKGTCEVNVPVHYIMAYCSGHEHTAEYDDMFHTGQVIEELGELTTVAYMEYKAIWPVSGRDFCAFNAIRIHSNDTYIIVARSIKHPSCPPTKKYVRGKILIGGFVMKELSKDPPRVMLTYISHVDLAGSVPSRIVNKVTANQPLSVGTIKKYVEKMYQDELANPDRESKFKTDAMRILGKLERAKDLIGDVKPVETLETMEEQPSASPSVKSVNGDFPRLETNSSPQTIHHSASAPQFHSPTIKAFPFDNVKADYKTIGNQASAGLLQEVFEVADVDITKPVGSSGIAYGQWEYRGTEKEVMMFRKIHMNEKMHSFLGKGIIPCSPAKVWEVVSSPKERYNFDNMLKESRVLETISECSVIEYLHFEAAYCFQKQARDFVILRTQRKEKDKYLLSGISIDYQNVPTKNNVTRGNVLASGWIIEPLLHNGQLYSMVSYLSQLNFGGNVPVNLLNLVARKQPLCVAYVRKYLESYGSGPGSRSRLSSSVPSMNL